MIRTITAPLAAALLLSLPLAAHAVLIQYTYTGTWQLRPDQPDLKGIDDRDFSITCVLNSAAAPFETFSDIYGDAANFNVASVTFSISGIGAQAGANILSNQNYVNPDWDLLRWSNPFPIGSDYFITNTIIFPYTKFNASSSHWLFTNADILGFGAVSYGNGIDNAVYDVVNGFAQAVIIPTPATFTLLALPALASLRRRIRS